MGRLRLRLDVALGIFVVIFANCVVQSQYFVENPTHIYVVDKGQDSVEDGQDSLEHEQQVPQDQQFMSRRGTSVSDEEDDDESGEDEEPQPPPKQRRFQHQSQPAGRTRPIKLPKDFDESVKRRMQVAKRPKRPLQGDPSPIHQDDDDGRRPESRLLWPFSIEISKGGKGGGEGWGPGHYGSYTSWAENGWGSGGGGPAHHGWGSYAHSHPYHNYGWEEEKGLTDEEILKSKHYKKYQKKKKKKIKKLKKKLKFKRLIQKILQKHITYLDKIAPY